MPTSNDIRVRVEGFSKMTATLRPDSGRVGFTRSSSAAGLQRVSEVEHLGLLGGRKVGVDEEVTDAHAVGAFPVSSAMRESRSATPNGLLKT